MKFQDLNFIAQIKKIWTRLNGMSNDITALATSVASTLVQGVTVVGNTFKVTNLAEGEVGSLNIKTARATATTIAAATVATTTLSIPTGAMLLGASITVNAAVTTAGATNQWLAAFSGGATTNLGVDVAGALNTKKNTLIVPVIATNTTQVTFTGENSENFVAGGIFEVVAYYIDLTSLGNV